MWRRRAAAKAETPSTTKPFRNNHSESGSRARLPRRHAPPRAPAPRPRGGGPAARGGLDVSAEKEERRREERVPQEGRREAAARRKLRLPLLLPPSPFPRLGPHQSTLPGGRTPRSSPRACGGTGRLDQQRVAELLSLIERGGGDLPPDPRVPRGGARRGGDGPRVPGARAAVEGRGRAGAGRGRAGAGRGRGGARRAGGRPSESSARRERTPRARRGGGRWSARGPRRGEAPPPAWARREGRATAKGATEATGATTRSRPRSRRSRPARPLPAPPFPPAAEAAFGRSRRAAALVRRAGILRQPRALAWGLVGAGLVAAGERGDGDGGGGGGDDARAAATRPLSLAGRPRRGPRRLGLALTLGSLFRCRGVLPRHRGGVGRCEQLRRGRGEELREKEEGLAAAAAMRRRRRRRTRGERGDERGKASPPPPLPFPSSSRSPSRLLERFVPPTRSAPTAG